jgi:hypothetical protein
MHVIHHVAHHALCVMKGRCTSNIMSLAAHTPIYPKTHPGWDTPTWVTVSSGPSPGSKTQKRQTLALQGVTYMPSWEGAGPFYPLSFGYLTPARRNDRLSCNLVTALKPFMKQWSKHVFFGHTCPSGCVRPQVEQGRTGRSDRQFFCKDSHSKGKS